MSPEKEKELNQAFEKLMAISLNQVPVEGLEELVAPNVMGYGTTIDEQVHNLEEYIALIKEQEEQAKEAGLIFSFERKEVHRNYFANDNSALIVLHIVATISSEKIKNELFFRFSSVMEHIDGNWKLVHWHGSIPSDSENDTWHVKEWEREKEKLEKQVAEQTTDLLKKNRELEIEAASERVRAKAMSMEKPNDIMNVLNVMKEEVDKFEFGNISTWIWTRDDNGMITQWDISEHIEEGNLVNFNLRFDINKFPEINRHTKEWERGKKYYTLNWQADKLQDIVNEVAEMDPESGKMFQEAVDVGQIEDYWQAAAPFSQGVVGLDFTSTPPETTEAILIKMSSAFNMAYQRFEDLQKAEAQAREAKVELSLERIRAQATGMQESSDLLDIVVTMHAEFTALGHEAHYFWHMRWLENTYEKAMTSGDGSKIGNVMELPRNFHQNEAMNKWEETDEPIGVFALDTDAAIDYIDRMVSEGRFDKIDHNAPGPDDIRAIEGITFVMARTTHGEIGYSLPGVVENPPVEDLETLERFAGVFDLAYRRFEDLLALEKRAYTLKIEASLERVRGMASAMNHSDDLMQIAEAMFKELEILKINPLRYGLGMINGETKEAELWASTVNDGHYLDMLGTISLTWHPMLQQTFDAWDAQHEEFTYKLEGEELSNYYLKIGEVNKDIPNLDQLQDPNTDIVQYASFFPFKSGALYAFTESEPNEEGRSILKQFSSVFEQAHIRYNDLQTAEKQDRQIREERDRLEIALKELKATQDQLVQQEKLASLGQLTAGIAHEIKNPLNFVNNFSEVSVELIDETKEELSAVSDQLSEEDREKVDEAMQILGFIEANLKKIHEHGSRADSIVKSMLEHSRGGSGILEPTNLNALIKEFTNLSFHGMRAAENPINLDLQFELDENITDVPLISEDFSRVILNLCNNAFDAMREKMIAEEEQETEESYKPVMTVRTHSEKGNVIVEVEDNGPGIPDEMKDKIMQPFYTTKKGTEGTGLGLSITNDIIKAHGGFIEIESTPGQGSIFKIVLIRS